MAPDPMTLNLVRQRLVREQDVNGFAAWCAILTRSAHPGRGTRRPAPGPYRRPARATEQGRGAMFGIVDSVAKFTSNGQTGWGLFEHLYV